MSELTILIPTLEGREKHLERLLNCLSDQLTDKTRLRIRKNQGEKTIGQIRDEMINKVETEYLVFIDDDDLVAPDYIAKHFELMATNPDAIGFKGIYTENGRAPREFEHRHGNDYKNYAVHFVRPICHINVIKTGIAKAIGYNAIKFGEDAEYTVKLAESGLIERAEFIDEIMYYYLYNSRK